MPKAKIKSFAITAEKYYINCEEDLAKNGTYAIFYDGNRTKYNKQNKPNKPDNSCHNIKITTMQEAHGAENGINISPIISQAYINKIYISVPIFTALYGLIFTLIFYMMPLYVVLTYMKSLAYNNISNIGYHPKHH